MATQKISLLAISMASALALTACGGGGSGSPSEPRLDTGGDDVDNRTPQERFCDDPNSVLTVETNGVMPADGAKDVALNSSVRVTFNAQLDPDTVNMSNVMLNGGSSGSVPSTIALNSDTITIDPNEDLESGITYEVDLSSGGIMAACEGTTKNAEPFTSTFTTSDVVDTTQPRALSSVPVNGETLAATDSQVVVEFDKPIDASSVSESSFTITPTQQNGDAIAATGPVSGTFSFNQGTVTFIPDENLNGQTYYNVNVSTNVRDLSGNALEAPFSADFRTGGLVVALNDGLVSRIPGLGDGLNLLVGQLFGLLETGNPDDGLSSADNLLTLKLPLVNDLAELPANFDPANFDPADFFGEGNLPEFDSAIVAVCDPTNIGPSGNPECTVSLDLGLDATQLQTLADAFTGGDPSQIPELFADALFAQNDGLGLDLAVLDDSGLPLPAPVQDGLDVVLNGLSMIPELGVLFDQTDLQSLARIGLLEGSLLSVDTGADLINIDLLNSRSFTGNGGLISVGGGLVDLLRLDLLLDNVTCPEALPFGLICRG